MSLKPSPESKQTFAPATRLVHAGRDPGEQHGFVNTPIYRGSTVLYPTYDAIKHRRGRYNYGTSATPTMDALTAAWTELAGAAGTVRDALGPRGAHRRADGRGLGRRPPPRHRFRLPADPPVLRRRAGALRRRDHLLRPDGRGRHRRPDAAEHQGRPGRGAGLAELRDAGHPGHRRGGACARRLRDHGQHLGDAAAVPAARARASTSPSRPAPSTCAATPTCCSA